MKALVNPVVLAVGTACLLPQGMPESGDTTGMTVTIEGETKASGVINNITS